MKRVLCLGAGGFIGGHLVKTLKSQGCWVRGVDLKQHEYCPNVCDEFTIGDLRDPTIVKEVFTNDEPFDEVYQLAADMGGAGYIFTGENDLNIMHNSALINLNVVEQCLKTKVKKVFYSSSACIYPSRNQKDPDSPLCTEESAYPADPDSEYGWEKLFSERLYLSAKRNYGLDVKIARYHNVFGPEGSWKGGKEKAPAAICRKVIEATDGTKIDIWGDGKQTRSFLYVSECIEATLKLMQSDFSGPVNIGSEEMISINDLAKMVINISGKNLTINNIDGPVGVRGRNSDNTLIKEKLSWNYKQDLKSGMKMIYDWIQTVSKGKNI